MMLNVIDIFAFLLVGGLSLELMVWLHGSARRNDGTARLSRGTTLMLTVMTVATVIALIVVLHR